MEMLSNPFVLFGLFLLALIIGIAWGVYKGKYRSAPPEPVSNQDSE